MGVRKYALMVNKSLVYNKSRLLLFVAPLQSDRWWSEITSFSNRRALQVNELICVFISKPMLSKANYVWEYWAKGLGCFDVRLHNRYTFEK